MEARPEQKRPIASWQARLRFSSSTIAGASQTLPSLQISLSFHRPLKPPAIEKTSQNNFGFAKQFGKGEPS
jgi:hypothetical protein